MLSFLTKVTEGTNKTTKRIRYSTLSAFFNFITDSVEPNLKNPCNAPMIKKMFKRAGTIQWAIIEKEVADEIIFRTTNTRNRLILELMARGGMRINEVLKITHSDVEERRLILRQTKSRRGEEVVYLPQKLIHRLEEYIREKRIYADQRIFPISYTTARLIVKRAGRLVGIDLKPHDLRRHAATYASRSGTPIEIVSKVILRHANLSTTQRYLGKVSDTEAMRWIENLYG